MLIIPCYLDSVPVNEPWHLNKHTIYEICKEKPTLNKTKESSDVADLILASEANTELPAASDAFHK